jgi:protein SCO1
MKMWSRKFVLVLVAMAALSVSRVRADGPAPYAGTASFIPDQYVNVGVTEHPDARLPMDLEFYNERAEVVKLGDFFKTDRPVILQLGYYNCPKLCDVVSRDLIDTAKQVELDAGTDFQFVFVSINPAESPDLAQLKKQSFIEAYGKPGTAGGFHCLVGKDRAIHALADAVGFRYNALDISGQYAHPAVLFVLTPDGRISRYLYGVTIPPRTLKLSIVEASAGKVGSSFDRLALMICCYDVATGKYAMTAINLMRFTALGTLLVLSVSMFWLFKYGSRVHGGPGGSSPIMK